ncbi:MAG TPA: polymer-forming cytoskeletal protein [Planctomycetota bacterium]|nr:polymer-forming cytoskeletal protein [Planctomycetota bacterium]
MSKDSARRLIFCPRCDARQEVSRVTKSTSCPSCHRNIMTTDVEINEYCAKIEMWTAGIVTVGKKGTLIAEVRAENVIVKGGEIKGPVTSRGSVTLDKGSKIFGNITAPLLSVGETQHLVGMIVAGPRASELLAEIGMLPPPAKSGPTPQVKKVPA